MVGESGSGKTTLGKIIVGYPEYLAQCGTRITWDPIKNNKGNMIIILNLGK